MIVQFISSATNQDLEVNFVACMDAVPRVGEIIITENKRQCVVRKVAYNCYRQESYSGFRIENEGLLCMQPIVEIELLADIV